MKPWKRDWGLTGRIWLTMFLLFLVYHAFIAVLSMLGIGLPFLVVIVFLMAFLQYFFSDRLVLWSTRARVIEPEEYPELTEQIVAQVEIEARYAGYLRRQQDEIERSRGTDDVRLPDDLDYAAIHGLSHEIRQES